MEKLDRLGWAAGMSFTSFGVTAGIRVNETESMDRLLVHLPPGWKTARSTVVEKLYSVVIGRSGPRSHVRRFHVVYGDSQIVARSADLEEMLDVFESHLHLHVAEMARRRLFVHAGVVGWKGQAIVIPGRTFSGKSTLVAEFVRAGAQYYSDEFAVMDDQGLVHPFTRPLTMRENGGQSKKRYTAEALGGSAGARPLPLGLLLLTQYKSGGGHWRPRGLSAGKGALALLEHAVSARRQPEKALGAVQRTMCQAHGLQGKRGEAKQVVDYVLHTLDR